MTFVTATKNPRRKCAYRVLDVNKRARLFAVFFASLTFGCMASSSRRAAKTAFHSSGEILFLSATKPGQCDIYSIRADGSGLRKISRQPLGCIGASWSPDKKSIVMAIATKVTTAKDWYYRYDLAIMKAQSGAVRKVPNAELTKVGVSNPAFSPSGKEIIFTGYSQHHFFALYKIGVNGQGFHQFTHHGTESGGRFSPDGKHIVFSSTQISSTRTGQKNIFTINADGSNVKQITHRSGENCFPVFSPNGRRIVFYSRGKSGKGNFQIVAMNADGSAQKALTDSKLNCLYPKFSPDGNQIAFDVSSRHSEQISVMNADGSHQKQITSLNPYCSFPDWR